MNKIQIDNFEGSFEFSIDWTGGKWFWLPKYEKAVNGRTVVRTFDWLRIQIVLVTVAL